MDIQRKHHNIDATDRPLGRLAAEIAVLLRGKHKPTFVPHQDMGDFVEVKNITRIRFTGKKMAQKIYRHHTGYMGGLKEIKLEKLFQKNPAEVLRKAVYGMLPKNKLRAVQINRLKSS